MVLQQLRISVLLLGFVTGCCNSGLVFLVRSYELRRRRLLGQLCELIELHSWSVAGVVSIVSGEIVSSWILSCAEQAPVYWLFPSFPSAARA